MEVVLTAEDLDKLNKLIQKTPFEYSFPFFQILRAKVEEAAAKQQEAAQVKTEDAPKPAKKALKSVD